MNKNVLLISPTLITETPMTLAMLAPIFQEKGFKVKAAVNTFKKPLTIEDFVTKAEGCDMIGISMLTFEILFVHRLIKALKQAGKFVIVGGPHPTDCPEEMIKAGADVVVVGEGEDVLREILGEYPDIKKGIRDRKPPVDLIKQPMPNLDIFDKETFMTPEGFMKGIHRIYTSRGCPGKCTFCDWQVFKQNIRFYSIPKIVDEIKRRIDNYGITSFSIADDCFTISKSRVMKFCELVSKITPKVTWRANARANLVWKDMLQAMKGSGCHSIAFGLESGDPETLKRINKMVTLEENIRAPWMAHEAELEVYGCLMTGFPWETKKHLENQLKFIYNVWDAVSLFQVSGSLMPFPGTAIYREFAKQYGFEQYWMKPEYQKFGIQVYQNALNPLAVSTFYERYLFDDTYIQEELFFNYSPEYKAKVREMVYEIGRHNLPFMLKKKPWKVKPYLKLAKLSMWGYDYLPNVEKKVGGWLYKNFHKQGRSNIERLRDKRRGISKVKT